MLITVNTELEAALQNLATQRGITPEALALDVLRQHLLPNAPLQARDEWEKRLLESARDWGFSLSDAALTRENMYE